MATPLFVTSEAVLKAKLRLSAVPASAGDTDAIFGEAVLRARLRLYAALGESRVTALLATAYTDTPTTSAQVQRSRASSVEVNMVRCTLLRVLPNAFMDASGDVDHRWNEEAPLREAGAEREAELERCENEIAQDLLLLTEETTGACDVRVYDGTPDCPSPKVGRSLRGQNNAFNRYFRP